MTNTTIPKNVEDAFNKQSLVAVGTSDRNCQPNIAVIYWKKIINQDTIIFLDNFMKKTKENILENEKMCVSFWDSKTEEGYKLKGTGKYHSSGDVFEEGKRFMQEKCPNRIPKGVLEFKVNEIFILTPGISAGKMIVQ